MPTATYRAAWAGRSTQIALSRAAEKRLITAYKGVWSDINSQLARLQQQIAETRKVGGDDAVKVSWLYQQQRLQQLQQQVTQAMTRFTGGAEQLTVDVMRQGAHNGAENALSALQAMIDTLNLPPDVTLVFNRLNFAALDDAANNAFTYGASAASTGNRVRTVADLYKKLPKDTAARAKQLIVNAVATGQAPSVTARFLRDLLGIGLDKAMLIARTETMNSYRRAGIATFNANSDVCNGWKWLAAADACPECAAQNGTVHTLDEEMDSHPRCRCVPEPLPRSLSDILAAFASDIGGADTGGADTGGGE